MPFWPPVGRARFGAVCSCCAELRVRRSAVAVLSGLGAGVLRRADTHPHRTTSWPPSSISTHTARQFFRPFPFSPTLRGSIASHFHFHPHCTATTPRNMESDSYRTAQPRGIFDPNPNRTAVWRGISMPNHAAPPPLRGTWMETHTAVRFGLATPRPPKPHGVGAGESRWRPAPRRHHGSSLRRRPAPRRGIGGDLRENPPTHCATARHRRGEPYCAAV